MCGWVATSTSQVFFMKYHFYLNNKLYYSSLDIWQIFSQNWTKVNLSLWRKLTVLATSDMSGFQKENCNFGRHIHQSESDSFSIFKTFPMRPVVVLTKVILKYYIMKCVNICPHRKGPRGLRSVPPKLDGSKSLTFIFRIQQIILFQTIYVTVS